MLLFIRELVKDHFGVEEILEAVFTRVEHDTQAFIYFFFKKGEDEPFITIKVSSDPERNDDLRREHSNLVSVYERLPVSMRTCLPQALNSGFWRGHFYFMQDFISGRMLSSIIEDSLIEEQWHEQEMDIRLAWEWLQSFQSATSSGTQCLKEFRLDLLLNDYKSAYNPSKLECANLNMLMPIFIECADRELPLVASHGDYFSGNIIMTVNGVKVIDWSYFRQQYHPCFDIAIFLSSFVTSKMEGNGNASIEDHFSRLYFEKHHISNFFSSLINEYMRKNRIETDIFSFLFELSLLEMSLRDYMQTGVSTVKDNIWRKRFMLFQSNRDKFALI